MKKSILVVFVLLFAGLQQAYSAKITYGNSEHIKVVHDFPNTDEYKDADGNYLDLGILYETFDLAHMPVWMSKEPKIVGLLNKNTNYYLELEPEFIDEIIAAHDLNKEELLKVSFWDKYLGAVIFLSLLGLAVLYSILFAKNDDEIKNDDVIEVIEDDKSKA